MAHGFAVQDGLGAVGSVIPHESSAHSVLVPDTELLFNAQFHRAGPDLVLTGRDGAHHLIPGYFSSEHHPALVAPNGAHLSPDTVDLLAGSAMPGHYAQAQPTAPADSIGKIEKVVGDVTVVRNGVSVALHVGDAVFKSDVVATGASSSCGISFPDGTALNLVANTRMALNDYAFDANSNANGALFTLVEGTFAFVAGKVAHQGDMKIATPVATMGIRGTTGVVQEQPNAPATITATAADHTYSFAVVPDIGTGVTGMWDVYLTDANGVIQRDANGNPIVLVTVSQSGYVTYLTPQGLGQPPLVTTEPATNSQYAFEQEMLEQLFRTLNPANLNNNNNGGSSTTPPPFQLPNPIPQLFEDSGKPFAINVPNGANPAAPATPTIIDIVVGPTGPLTVVIWEAGGNGSWSSGPSWLGGTPPTSPEEVIIPDGHKVSTDGADSAAGLEVDGASIVNIFSGTSLTIYDFIHGTGTVQLNSTGSDPTLVIHGAVPLVGGGTIKMIGTAGQNFILGAPGTSAVLINVDYTIEGTGTIGGGDGNLTFQNFGTVKANDGVLTINTGNLVANNGLMEATLGGTLAIDDGVSNVGTLEATAGGILQLEHLTVTNSAAGVLSIDALSELDLMGAKVIGGTSTNAGHVVVTDGASVLHGDSVTNFGTMTVEAGASLTLEGNTTLINEAGGLIKADGGTIAIELDTDTNVNSGTIEAVNGGEVDFHINVEGGSNHGLIEAGAGGTVHFYQTHHDGGGGGGGQGGNYGTMEATDGGALIFDGGLDNFHLVEAVNGGTIDLNNGLKNHAGTVEALSGGIINIDSGVINENGATVEANDAGSQVDIDGFVDNFGTIQATGANAYVDLANGNFDNEIGGLIEADNGGTIIFDATLNGGTNTGVMEAGADGTILIRSFSGNGLFNASASPFGIGVIEAVGENAKVELDGATIVGGKLGTSGGGVFETVSGTSTLMNVILTGGTFKIDSGTILDLNGGSNGVAAYIDSTVILKGPGTVEMDFTSYSIRGGLSNGTLNNQTTIEGRGTIGTGDTPLPGVLTLVNSGTIEAVGGEFVINTGTRNSATTTNSGALEANGANAVLLIDFTNMNNAHGTIAALNAENAVAATASVVELLDDVIVGGTLRTSNFGTIETITNNGGASTTVFDGVANQGYVLVNDETTLLLRDTIDNTGGKIALALSGSSNLQIDGTVTLKNGQVELNTSGDEITALTAGAKLENSANIHGQGKIGTGDGTLTFDNLLGGVVNANQAKETLDVHTGNTVTNNGTLEATGGGTLKIEDSVINTAEFITASGLGSDIELSGATLENNGGGSITADLNSTMTFAGVAFTNNGGLLANNSSHIFYNGGSVTNNGGIEAVNSAEITFDKVAVSNTDEIQALYQGSIIFKSDGTTGVINDGGIIDAGGGGTITFDSSLSGVTNESTGGPESGFIIAEANSTITFGAITVTNDTGTITVFGANSAVDLNGATINGGTLKTDSAGVIDALTGTSTFDGVTIAGGFIKAESGATVDLEHQTTLSGTVTIEGCGTFVLDDPSEVASIVAGAAGGTLDIAAGATLTGSGDIGNAGSDGATSLTLNNAGTIDADGDGAAIDINTGTTVTNLGILEATHGGILEIDDNVCNIGGTIAAYGCGSVVALEGVTIKGGMFLTDDSTAGDRGVIEVANTAAATVFDGGSGHAVSIGGFVHVLGGASLELIGTIDLAAHGQNGTIDVDVIHVTDSPDIGADLVIHGTVTLSGAGAVVMEGDAAKITAAAPGAELHNATTIAGAGSIGVGDNDLTVVNESCGVINANNASAVISLTIATGCNTIVNHGLLEATGGGTLDIVSHVDNACGSLLATSGGVLDVQSCISGGTATIHGATLEFDAASNVNVTFCNGSVDSPTYGTLVLGDPAHFCGTIANFTGTCPDANHSDTIDLADFKACNTTLHASYNGDDGITTLCVVDKTDGLSATLKLIGPYSTDNFTIASDDKGGIDIFDPPTTGAKDAPATVAAAPGNEHTAAPAHQNGTDHAANPATEAGFGGDQSSVNVSPHDGDAAPLTNQLAPLAALGGDQPSNSAIETAFGIGHAGVDPVAGTANGNVTEADAGATLTNTGSTQTLLSSLLNVLTDNTSPIAIVAPGTPVLDSEHLTDSTIVDGSGAANSEAAPSAPPTASTNEHTVAPATVTPLPPPATSPVLASASFGGLGNDNFAFHPNLGSDTARNADAHTGELAHNNTQISGPALASTAPEFHQEFAFDAIHQDAANLAAAVDQFHQMAANSTLLH
jgi:hypothetical protein